MKNTRKETQNTSKNKYKQKGITLIALIITIIVMLILVGVTISISLNGGLFGYAKKATKDTKNALEQEKTLANGDIIDYYLNVNQEIQALPEYDKAEKTEGILTENAKYVEGTDIAIIPKGFKMSDKKEEQSIANGLVIQDEAGNEYVWVPVKDGTLDRTEWFNNTEGNEIIRKLDNNEYSKEEMKEIIIKSAGYNSEEEALKVTGASNWEELVKKYGYNSEEEGLRKMCTLNSNYTETIPEEILTSVKTNKGFYIGRYEAGSEEVRTNAKKDILTDVLVKRGLYPYDYVSQANAVSKIEEMYLDKTKYGVKATLPYGAMWDETMRFVKDDDHNVTNSTIWGNYSNTSFKITGKYCEDPNATTPIYTEGTNIDKPKDTSWLLTTGASERNKAKNIYDLAGNVWEWTNELYLSCKVFRGGNYNDGGNNRWASYRELDDFTLEDEGYHVGFRPALYIK